MGDENPIRTLGDYSKPSYGGYRNTIELPVGNNVVPFLSDTIWLVQNGCSFHGLRSQDPNQHLKDFLKLVDSLDLDGDNRERTSTSIRTTYEARVRDYMAAHTERMERFENTIFKQREKINDRKTKIFRLLKKHTTSKAPEKVLIREEAKSSVTKSINFISLIRDEKEKTTHTTMVLNKLSWRINEKLIEGLFDNHRFNDSLSGARIRKVKGKTYNVLPGGIVYKAILKRKITKKEDIGGNFEIPCSIGDLKHVNALVDQGFDVNVMPYFTYIKLTNEKPAETDIRLSLASHSYIYPLGIAKDILVVVEHVFPVT
nr:MAK10-like protein [Tanacetum cinerariifolium]